MGGKNFETTTKFEQEDINNTNSVPVEPVIYDPETIEVTENNNTKKEEVKKETKEKREPIKESASKKILEKAKLNYEESLSLIAEILKVDAKYNEIFIKKLKQKQKELGLKPDGILGDKTIGVILAQNPDKLDISLTEDTEIINFNKAIKEGKVTKPMLEGIRTKISKFIANKPKKSTDGKYYADSFFGANITNILIAKKLLENFRKTSQGQKEEFNEVYKQIEEDETKNTQKLVKNSIDIIKTLDPKAKEALTKLTNQQGLLDTNISTNSNSSVPTTLEGKLAAAANEIKKNPTLMLGAMIGFIMFIFGSRNKFAQIGFYGTLGVVAGPAALNTLKNIGKIFGIDLNIDPEKVEQAKQATSNFIDNTSQTVKDGWEKTAKILGVGVDKIKESISSKNDEIITTMKANENGLDDSKLEAIKNISLDPTFKVTKIDDITKFNFNSLSKDIKKKLNDAGINKNSKEFKLYLETLKEKIDEAKKEDNDIQTVGDYFDKYSITADQVSIATGVGMMGLSLITKSPTTFFIGASAVGAGLAGAWEKFFGSETYKNIESKTKNIVENATVLMNDKIDNTLKGNDKLIQNIKRILNKEKLDNDDFEAIKKLGDSNPTYKDKLEKLSKDLEKEYYETQVKVFEDSDIIPKFIKDIYKTAEEYSTELTDSFDKKKEQINLSIKQIENLKTKINKSGLEDPQKKLLITRLDAQIEKAEAQINLVESQKEKSKIENENKLKNEISKLKEELNQLKEANKKLDSNNPEQNVKIQENKIKILKLEQKIKQKQAELTKATAIVSKIQTEKIEKQENTEKLENSVKNIKDFSTKSLDKIYSNISTLKNDINFIKKTKKEYSGTVENIKTLISEGEKNITDLINKIKSFADKIIGEIKANNLLNYPADKISKYKEILKTLDIYSNNFDTTLKTKKKQIFNDKINNASIEEIEVFRKNFKNTGIENFEKKIEERLKVLAENTKISQIYNLKNLVKNSTYKGNKLTQNEINDIEKLTIKEFYDKYSPINSTNFSNKNKILNKIKELYKGIDFKNIQNNNTQPSININTNTETTNLNEVKLSKKEEELYGELIS